MRALGGILRAWVANYHSYGCVGSCRIDGGPVGNARARRLRNSPLGDPGRRARQRGAASDRLGRELFPRAAAVSFKLRHEPIGLAVRDDRVLGQNPNVGRCDILRTVVAINAAVTGSMRHKRQFMLLLPQWSSHCRPPDTDHKTWAVKWLRATASTRSRMERSRRRGDRFAVRETR
jgi:hypothetical protein